MTTAKRESNSVLTSATFLLLDIEGTTTSISFVKDVLFPYVREHLEAYVKEKWDSEDFQEIVKALRTQVKEDQENRVEGVIAILESGEKDALVRTVLDNVVWQMDNDRKTKSLKDLQGLIMEEGYQKGELKGHVYDDVEPSLKSWCEQDKSIYIYSSGSIHAQKLLFGHSEKGDLLPFIKGHFDTSVGMKGEAASYKKILANISCSPSEAAFLTDIPKEARAAKEAGMFAILLSRFENPPLTDEDAAEFPVIQSFVELEFEQNSKKRKISTESDVKSGNKPVTICVLSVENPKPDEDMDVGQCAEDDTVTEEKTVESKEEINICKGSVKESIHENNEITVDNEEKLNSLSDIKIESVCENAAEPVQKNIEIAPFGSLIQVTKMENKQNVNTHEILNGKKDEIQDTFNKVSGENKQPDVAAGKSNEQMLEQKESTESINESSFENTTLTEVVGIETKHSIECNVSSPKKENVNDISPATKENKLKFIPELKEIEEKRKEMKLVKTDNVNLGNNTGESKDSVGKGSEEVSKVDNAKSLASECENLLPLFDGSEDKSVSIKKTQECMEVESEMSQTCTLPNQDILSEHKPKVNTESKELIETRSLNIQSNETKVISLPDGVGKDITVHESHISSNEVSDVESNVKNNVKTETPDTSQKVDGNKSEEKENVDLNELDQSKVVSLPHCTQKDNSVYESHDIPIHQKTDMEPNVIDVKDNVKTETLDISQKITSNDSEEKKKVDLNEIKTTVPEQCMEIEPEITKTYTFPKQDILTETQSPKCNTESEELIETRSQYIQLNETKVISLPDSVGKDITVDESHICTSQITDVESDVDVKNNVKTETPDTSQKVDSNESEEKENVHLNELDQSKVVLPHCTGKDDSVCESRDIPIHQETDMKANVIDVKDNVKTETPDISQKMDSNELAEKDQVDISKIEINVPCLEKTEVNSGEKSQPEGEKEEEPKENNEMTQKHMLSNGNSSEKSINGVSTPALGEYNEDDTTKTSLLQEGKKCNPSNTNPAGHIEA